MKFSFWTFITRHFYLKAAVILLIVMPLNLHAADTAVVEPEDTFRLSATIKSPAMRQWCEDNASNLCFFMEAGQKIFPLGTMEIDAENNGRVPISDSVPIIQEHNLFRIYVLYTDTKAWRTIKDTCLFEQTDVKGNKSFVDYCYSYLSLQEDPASYNIIEALRLDLDFNQYEENVPIRLTGLVKRAKKKFQEGITLTQPNYSPASLYNFSGSGLPEDILQLAYEDIYPKTFSIIPCVQKCRSKSYVVPGSHEEGEKDIINTASSQTLLTGSMIQWLETQKQKVLTDEEKEDVIHYLLHRGQVHRSEIPTLKSTLSITGKKSDASE
ncbi:MAG: hypothetical protein K2X98_01005 [Alphaproteobacteria bacterium]|nr:hypothetical protein [Alphaproteobacteria bacterium]